MKKVFSLILALLMVTGSIAVFADSFSEGYLPSPTWKITVSSDRGNTAKNMIDGYKNSYWHSAYQVENGSIVSRDNAPFEVVVTFPTEKNIAGIRYLPRQIDGGDNSSAGIVTKLSVYASLNGTTFTHVRDDIYTYQNSADRSEKTTVFDMVRAKAMKIVFTEGVGGYGTCAELTFLKSSPSDPDDEDGGEPTALEHMAKAQSVKPVGEAERDAFEYSTTWVITATSSLSSSGVANMFDRDKSTYWHSWYLYDGTKISEKDVPPFDITVEFPYTKWVSGVRYTPRQDGIGSGIISQIEILGSGDGTTFERLARENYSYASGDKTSRTTRFEEKKLKAVKVRFLDGAGGYATCAELEFLRGKSDVGTASSKPMVETRETVSIYEDTIKASPVNAQGSAMSDAWPYESSWDIAATSAMDAANLAALFDRNVNTRWHSWYRAEGSDVVEHDTPPYDFFITFPEKKTVSGLRYTPRQDGRTTGIFEAAEVYGSEDGVKYVLLGKASYDYGGNYQPAKAQTITFAPVRLKTICYRVTRTLGQNHGTGAEIELLKGDDSQAVDVTDYMTVAEHLIGTIALTIDSYEADNDGIPIKLVAPAVIREARTLVPIRFVSEALGAMVTWNPERRRVGILKDDTTVFLTIDSNKATINGKSYLLDAPASLMNNSTMVPIRFVSEALGSEVEWVEEARQVLIRYRKSIALWGDGLASSAGSLTEGMEKGLYYYTGGISVAAYGGENENALTVAARQGAYDIVLAEDVTLTGTGGTEVKIALADGRAIVPRSGLGGWNPCTIGSNSGILTFDVDYTTSPRTLRSARFIRSTEGEAIRLPKGTSVVPAASFANADINVFMLANSRTNRESPEELVQIICDMIEHTSNKTKFIVVTPLEGTKEELAPYEEAYREAFGDKVFNIREAFMAEETLRENDVVPEEGEEDIVPRAFLRGKNDQAHLNDLGYNALAKQLHQKMVELGYILQ